MKKSLQFYMLALLTVFFAPSVSAEEQKMNILKVYDQFVMANKAADLCAQPSQEQRKNNAKNYILVSMRAMQEIMKLKPEFSKQNVIDVMQKRSKSLVETVDIMIKESGCSDPKTQDLLKRYEIQSNLKFG